MKYKLAIMGALLAAATFATNAVAGPTWTINTTGTIVAGNDTSGVFGLAGKSLVGLTYTQSINASVDNTQYKYFQQAVGVNEMWGSAPSTNYSVTVNGITKSFTTLAGEYAEQILLAQFEDTSGNRLDSMQSDLEGATTDGSYILGAASLYSYSTAFVPSLDFMHGFTVNGNGFTGSSAFRITSNGNAFFRGDISLLEVSVSANASDVPEPASLALMSLGLVGVALARCRRVKRF